MDSLLKKAISEVKAKHAEGVARTGKSPYEKQQDLIDDLFMRSGFDFGKDEDAVEILHAIQQDPELMDIFNPLPE